MHLVVLWTDLLVYILVISIIGFMFWSSRHEHWRAPWRRLARSKLGMVSLMILLVYVAIGLLDSVHLQSNGRIRSAFDLLVSPLGVHHEQTYSAPFAKRLYNKKTVFLTDGQQQRIYPQLKHVNTVNIGLQVGIAAIESIAIWAIILALAMLIVARINKQTYVHTLNRVIRGQAQVPWRLLSIELFIIVFLIMLAVNLASHYHIFGTDKVGQDVFYETLKSIRTGLLIGTLATLVMLPFAIGFGITAGYFGGIIDDIVQYIYTTLSSIPAVLLIAAAVLSLQIYIANHPQVFPTVTERADIRLLALCVILGVTSWTILCRLLRGETFKLREMDYIQAAQALGTSRIKILFKHVLPNVMHIILISVVLDFSGLVLAEAVLSYVGVGVDPVTMSWGNMINAARLELAREPVVWWPLLAAFIFMFIFVLAANLLADAVRDALDPRIR